MASIFWMLVTWFLWFLPDILLLMTDNGSVAIRHHQVLFALTFDPTWPQRHTSGAVYAQRHGAALLLPTRLPHRPRLGQGHRRGEENGGSVATACRAEGRCVLTGFFVPSERAGVG